MEDKKIIYIVGIGGRTGSMFAHEMRNAAKIIGVGMDAEAKAIAEGRLMMAKNGAAPEALNAPVVMPQDLAGAIEKDYPDFIWLAVRNPVTEAVKSYYRFFKGEENIPALILSQNGISAIGDAKTALREVLGHDADKVRIIRISLLNGVDLKFEEPPASEASMGRGAAFAKASASRGRTAVIGYKLPVKLGIGNAGGKAVRDLKEIMEEGGIKCQEFGDKVFEMENSKLFTNLIGMAAAADGMTVSAGFRDRETFKKEVAMLREFVLAAKASGTGFSPNFLGYPIKLLAALMLFPAGILIPFRGIFEAVVVRGRNRPKDLLEIDYYNGEVVRLGKLHGVATPINVAIVKRAKELTTKNQG